MEDIIKKAIASEIDKIKTHFQYDGWDLKYSASLENIADDVWRGLKGAVSMSFMHELEKLGNVKYDFQDQKLKLVKKSNKKGRK